MIITRTGAVAVIGFGLAASGALLTQSLAGERAPGPLVATTTTPLPIEELVARAASKAALVQLCLDGFGDPEANAQYLRARAAHPDEADGIGPDCGLNVSAP